MRISSTWESWGKGLPFFLWKIQTIPKPMKIISSILYEFLESFFFQAYQVLQLVFKLSTSEEQWNAIVLSFPKLGNSVPYLLDISLSQSTVIVNENCTILAWYLESIPESMKMLQYLLLSELTFLPQFFKLGPVCKSYVAPWVNGRPLLTSDFRISVCRIPSSVSNSGFIVGESLTARVLIWLIKRSWWLSGPIPSVNHKAAICFAFSIARRTRVR